MPTAPIARFGPFEPEIEKKEGGWAVLYYTGDHWILSHATTEGEAKVQAEKAAERIHVSNEFVLVVPVSLAFFPKR